MAPRQVRPPLSGLSRAEARRHVNYLPTYLQLTVFLWPLPWIVTFAGAKLHPTPAGAGALAKLAPRTPVSILFFDVSGQPDAVTFNAVLDKNTVQVVCAVWTIVPSEIGQIHMRTTFPFPHVVPSMGGPFLVLQKKGFSGWLHHSCLHGSNVRYCRGTDNN